MKKFELTGDYPLRHNGKEYQPGDTVEMEEAQAASKVESGRLVEIGTGKKSDDDTKDAGGKDSAPESASEDKGGDAKSSGATGGRKAGGK